MAKQQPYSGGVELLDQYGNLSVVLDIRAHQDIVHLTMNVIGGRASGNVTADLDSEELDDLLLALSAAKDCAWPQLDRTGAPG